MKDLKEAYRDAISVWHPDRFSANARLKMKAEKKAAQINEAYEIVAAHIARRNEGVRQERGPRRSRSGAGGVERAAETGTRVALHVGYAVYSAIRRLTSWK